MRVLICGSNGQLGSELRQLAQSFSGCTFVFSDLPEFNITKKEETLNAIRELKPEIVVNCAAYTAVDQAENDKDTAFSVNAQGAENLAVACREVDALLIHISTDFVFDGRATKPYGPEDETNPLCVYGDSKALGEQMIVSSGCQFIIVRTSWLYSAYGKNFVYTMRRLGKSRNELGVISDQYGCPTWAADLATVIIEFINNPKRREMGGVYHYSNSGSTSWFGFATKIMELSGLDCKVNPIGTDEYPTPAKRPAYSVMNCDKISNTLQIKIPSWESSLQSCISIINERENVEHEGES